MTTTTTTTTTMMMMMMMMMMMITIILMMNEGYGMRDTTIEDQTSPALMLCFP